MITLSGSPDKISPAYNPVVYFIDSDNKNDEGFRYIVDVYPSGSLTKLAEFRIAPRPIDGLGYIDLSKLLSTQVSYTFDPTLTGSTNAVDSYYTYDIKFGEEAYETWTYDDFQFYNNTGSTYYFYTELTTLTASTGNAFVAGDQVIVTQVSGGTALNPQIDGLHTVVVGQPDVTDQSVVIDLFAGGLVSGGPFGGEIRYADGRRAITRDLLVITGVSVFNGALSFKDFPNYDYTDYGLWNSNGQRSAFTNMPTVFYATPDQDIWLNYMKGDTDVVSQDIRFTNSNGDVLQMTNFWSNTNNGVVRQAAVGPNNANPTSVISGTAPLVKSNTEWYEFRTRTASNSATTKTYRIYIDRRCKIEDYEILFLDRLGSMNSFAFQLRSRETGTIERVQYNKQLGDLIGDKWSYATYDYGMTNTNINVEKELELNTDWMTDEMSVYFEELLTSPYTFVKVDGNYYACIILDSSFEVQRQKNKNLIRKTVKIRFANQNIINI